MVFYDATVWGPHYWFFLHSIAFTYPEYPNKITKRKYYDLIQNFPLFIPSEEIGNKFSELIDKYPVTPYLGSRESFSRWTVFIHNKVNQILGKKELTYLEGCDEFFNHYKPKQVSLSEKFKWNKKYLHFLIIFVLLIFIYFYS
jgi:hypothetical protein